MKSVTQRLGRIFLGGVFLFFYAPILSVVVYSFNASPIASVWAGFSTEWYGRLLEDEELLQSGWISLQLALATATASVFIGAWIGFVLASYKRFAGQALFTAMVNAPMVLPEVI
jgi:putrescine transport system permease protein